MAFIVNERVLATVNLKALQTNFHKAKLLSGHSKMVAVIKANGYGHGLIPVATALSEAELFAVTDLTEALLLRDGLDVTQSEIPILILQGFIQRDEIKSICESDFQLVVHSLTQLEILDHEINRINLKKPLTLWLKMDSGMGRLGLAAQEYADAYRSLIAKPYVKEVIMMTHLANASLPGSPLIDQQLDSFAKVKAELKAENPVTSIAASSGILSEANTESDWARLGIMLYGSSPFPFDNTPLRAAALGLKPVMTLRSQIISIKNFRAGDNVGYCSQFICPNDMRIGIVSVGYADGYPSNAPNGTPVLVNDQRTETVGRVSMDMIAIDLSSFADAKEGDPVTLWGESPPAKGLSEKYLCVDEIAAHTGILSYNLLCNITRRVNFVYG